MRDDLSHFVVKTTHYQMESVTRESVARLVLAIFIVFMLDGSARLARAESVAKLTTAEQIRQLTPEQADLHRPVRLRGVITFFDQKIPTKAFRFIQDNTAGIYFYWNAAANDPKLAAGQLVEIQGETGRGEYAPVVFAHRIRILGEGTFPTAKPVSFEQLASGQEDSQFVEIHGVVRSIQKDKESNLNSIEIATGGGRLTALAVQSTVSPGENLVDSIVRINGVCITRFNRHRQLFDVGLLIPQPDDLLIEKSAPNDPFAIPAQPIESLLRFALEGTYKHRQKVVGTVALGYSDKMYIQNKSDGLFVQMTQPGNADIGDQVEVLGFPTKGDYTPMLQNAIYRKIASGTLPIPDQISADEALNGAYDCRLVQLKATLLDRAQNGKETFLVLQAGGIVFQAYVKWQGHSVDYDNLRNGSKVSVTGVCLINPGENWYAAEAWRAESFRILLRSPKDIIVLESPSWWTLKKLLWAVGFLVAFVLIAFSWVVVLDRRVQRQTRVINEKLHVEAALKERYVQLFENANEVVYTHDLTGRITSINKAGEQLLQRKRQEILSKNLVELIAEEQRPAAQQWLDQVVKGGPTPTAEWNFINETGQRLKWEITARVIAQAGGDFEVEGMARDITERRRLEREILQISTIEQQRIGHDLHDGVCQQLAAIAYRTHILARRWQEKGGNGVAELETIGELINEALIQTRGVAHGLFPVRLEENGLISALEELAIHIGKLYEIKCIFTCAASIAAVENSVALHVYYIAQEAMVNAAKHGKANCISVHLAQARDCWILTVQDDGTGFELTDGKKGGMGIGIMQYRARVIGATLDLKNQLNHGTRVTCEFYPTVGESVII